MTAEEIRLRCIEAAAQVFRGRMGAMGKDVLDAAEDFEGWVRRAAPLNDHSTGQGTP